MPSLRAKRRNPKQLRVNSEKLYNDSYHRLLTFNSQLSTIHSLRSVQNDKSESVIPSEVKESIANEE